jgi:hypothetical protein
LYFFNGCTLDYKSTVEENHKKIYLEYVRLVNEKKIDPTKIPNTNVHFKIPTQYKPLNNYQRKTQLSVKHKRDYHDFDVRQHAHQVDMSGYFADRVIERPPQPYINSYNINTNTIVNNTPIVITTSTIDSNVNTDSNVNNNNINSNNTVYPKTYVKKNLLRKTI